MLIAGGQCRGVGGVAVSGGRGGGSRRQRHWLAALGGGLGLWQQGKPKWKANASRIISFLLWGVLVAGLQHGCAVSSCVCAYMLFMYDGTCVS
jgi:hypothetical protein